MADRASQLAALKEALSEQLAAVSSKRRRISREHSRKTKSETASHLCKEVSAAKLRVLRCLMVLSEGDVSASMMILKQMKKSTVEETQATVAEEFKAWWSSLSPTARRAWLDGISNRAGGNYALQAARKFATESKVSLWVTHQNLTKGIAPCTHVLLDECRAKDDGLLSSGYALPTQRKSRLQWVKRFRRRWGVRMGRTMNREVMGKVQMAQKA